MLQSLLIKGAGDGHAALLIGLQNLGLVGDGKLGLALGHSLSGLGGGLIGSQLQLVTGAHLSEQGCGQECLRAGGAVDSHTDLIAGGYIGLQVGDGLDIQISGGGEHKDGGVEVFHIGKVLSGKLHFGRIDDGGNRQQALAHKYQLGIIGLGVHDPGIDSGGIALNCLGDQSDRVGILSGLRGGLLAHHSRYTGGGPGAGHLPAGLLDSSGGGAGACTRIARASVIGSGVFSTVAAASQQTNGHCKSKR